MPNPLIIIPARLNATRLPRKPLAMIGALPMIVHVWRRAVEAAIGPVSVATDSHEIAEAVSMAGGFAILTRDDHQSGSDRVYEALCALDPREKHDVIVNLQGDLPTIEPRFVSACAASLEYGADIATLAAPIENAAEALNPNVVKVIGSPLVDSLMNALYFTRALAPYGPGSLYHHIGVYAFRREALSRFVKLPPSPLEMRERLEQLRALEAGMSIHVSIVDTVPLGVDTEADLSEARRILAGQFVESK